MQCYPSYAMYWTVLAAGNWTTGQVNCQGQLGSNIAAYHGKLGYIHTYIYKLYLRIISLIMKALPSNIHSLKRNGRPRDAIQIIREMKHPELHLYINHNCFWNILKWSIFLVGLASSGFHSSLMFLHLTFFFLHLVFVFSLFLVDGGGCNDEKHNVGT